jgi:TPR repeat protein
MTEQTEKDKKFNLEDWVTNRAANQAPAEREDKQINAYQAPRTVSGVITMTGNGAATAQVVRTPSQDANGAAEQNDTMRSASSNTKPVVEPLRFASALGTASQQIQIVRLLQDLGDRLRASEKEREILWRELESTRKLIGDIDGKAEKVEKAYLTLENKVSSQPDHKNDIETQKKSLDDVMAEQKKLLDKISSLETTAGSTVVRVEDVLTENHKLAKRLDQVAQDKIRLQRKMDIMEETLTQTQDALKAKALVLLTDQALAQRTALPQVQAFTDQDKERLAFLQQQNTQNINQQAAQIAAHTAGKSVPNSTSDDSSSMVWWKQGADMFGNNANTWRKVATVGLIALGIAGGFALSKLTPTPVQSNAEQVGDVVPAAGEKSQEELMADIATMANQIEPAATSSDQQDANMASSFTSPETMDKIRASEESALKNFESKMPAGDVSARIVTDKNLTGNAKELETKALAGDANAQHDLAALYSAGHAGVTADYKRAVAWFTEAAHNEMPNAQYNLGVLKQQGLGTAQDTKGAMDLYRLAAMHNHPEAQYNLGIASIEGIGAEYDPSIAAYYFERAAANGIVEAAYNMGLIQENGLLGDSQPDEAVFWYKLGADKGHAESQKALTQLKTQLAMKDEDVTRIFNRIQALRPNALGNGAGAANASASNEVTPAATNDNKTFIDNMKSMF